MMTDATTHEDRSPFDALLNPRAIAIVGATPDATRIGGQPQRILRSAGYRGAVYPVNPKYEEVEGVRCYASVRDVPRDCDLAVVAVGAALVPQVIRECGGAGIPYAIVFSAGFREAGPDGAELEEALKRAARESRVRVVGPNCIGTMNLVHRVYCGFGAGFANPNLRSGPIAFASQSGGFAFSVVALAEHEGLGFNYIVSAGNEADVTTLDLLAEFVERDDVEIVVSYIEGIADGRRLRSIGARALELGKPILVWKAGNSESGRAAAQSHTASMTAAYDLYRAAFAEGGFIEVTDVHDLVDCARAFLGRRLPRGPRVAVLTTSGGSGVLIADGCVAHGLTLPTLSPETQAKLATYAPSYSALSNPVDLTAQVTGDHARFNRAVGDVLADPAVDQLIVRYGAVQGPKAEDWAEDLARLAREHDKPVLVAWSRVPDRGEPALRKLEDERVPWLLTPARAAKAAGALYEFAHKREAFDRRRRRGEQRIAARQSFEWHGDVGTLSENESKARLAAYGIRSTHDIVVPLDEIEALGSVPLTFPVVVKIDSPDLPHKTEAGAVRVGVSSLGELKRAASEIVASARRYKPDARTNGILISEMARGTEVILGAANDAYFGPVVMFGLGGIHAEILRDVAYRFAPFDTETAREMILETRGSALLRGYRGQPPADIDALADMVARLSLFASHQAEYVESVDLNPVFVSEHGAVAADALIVRKPTSQGAS
jgi:acyl-CoA synthetase (NDP forming)